MRARVGDRLVIDDGNNRVGIIMSVLGQNGSPPYVIKWLGDGHLAMVFPDQYARVMPGGHPAGLLLETETEQ
jgi:hypothetical protein